MFSFKDEKFQKDFENFMKRGSPINGSFSKTEDKITLEQQETDRVIRRQRTLVRTKYQIDVDDIWSKSAKSSKFKCTGPERTFKMEKNSEFKKKDVARDASAKRKSQRGQQKIKENSSDSSLTWHQQLSKSKTSAQDNSKRRQVLQSYKKCPGTVPKKNSKGSVRQSQKKAAKNQHDIENQSQNETKNIENDDYVKHDREINSRISNITNDHEQHPFKSETKKNRSLSTQTSPIFLRYSNEAEKKKKKIDEPTNERSYSKSKENVKACLSQESPRSPNLPCLCGLDVFNSLQTAKIFRDADRSEMLDSPRASSVTTEIHKRNLREWKLLTPFKKIPSGNNANCRSDEKERISGTFSTHKTSSQKNLTGCSKSSLKEESLPFHAAYTNLKSYIEQKPLFSKKIKKTGNNLECELKEWIKTIEPKSQHSKSWQNYESEAVMKKPPNFEYRGKKYQRASLCDSQPELLWKQASPVTDCRNSSSSSSNRKSIALTKHSFEKQKETFQKEVQDTDKIHTENLYSERTESETSASRNDNTLNKRKKCEKFPPRTLIQTEDYIPNDLMAKCKNKDIIASCRYGIAKTTDDRKITANRSSVQAVVESKNEESSQCGDANLRIGPLADYNGCPCMLEKYTQLLSFLDYDPDCL